ncbi:MAG: hypothetical protein HYU27_02385 [Acidobacteria bacterium]|nr:hypothetical protein [Acidobacteriota bacterium]
MSNHLSEDRFAKCAVGRPARAELEHISECAECSAELARFGNTLSLFRGAIRERIDARVGSHTPAAVPFSTRPAAAGMSKWRWALGAAAVVAFVLGMRPFFTSENKPQEVREQVSTETSPDAVMDAVNLHLSRTVPAPMERMMSLIPSEQLTAESGGVQ